MNIEIAKCEAQHTANIKNIAKLRHETVSDYKLMNAVN